MHESMDAPRADVAGGGEPTDAAASGPRGGARPHVYGRTVDDETRCVHYATAVDVIAIRFACCDRYYPCHACHEEAESHPVVRRARAEWDDPGILCGVCGTQLSVNAYRAADACPACGATFNPRCRLHWDRYFEA